MRLAVIKLVHSTEHVVDLNITAPVQPEPELAHGRLGGLQKPRSCSLSLQHAFHRSDHLEARVIHVQVTGAGWESCCGWDHAVGVWMGPNESPPRCKALLLEYVGVQTVACITLTEVVIGEW